MLKITQAAAFSFFLVFACGGLSYAAEAIKDAPTEEAEKSPFLYHPDPCEFAVTFPEEPYTSRRCNPEDKDKCYDLVSYTKVFDMKSTVNFRVTCSAVSAEMQKHYDENVMVATVRAMTRRSVVDSFNTSFREDEAGYRQAGLVGQGKSGTMPMIYIAQLWIGGHSALSVEAELIGEVHPEADALFSEILKSAHFVAADDKKATEDKKKPAPEKSAGPAAGD